MTTQHVHETPERDMTTLMTHIIKDHDDVPADDVYTAIRSGNLILLHEKQHPTDRPEKVTFRYYLHDSEYSGLYDYLTNPPTGRFSNGDPALPHDIAHEIAEAQPFYEVTVTVEYDTVTKKFTIIEAK
jgi:hypothetical protein